MVERLVLTCWSVLTLIYQEGLPGMRGHAASFC